MVDWKFVCPFHQHSDDDHDLQMMIFFFFFAKHDFSMIIQISKKKNICCTFFFSLSKSLFEKITLFSPNSTQMWLNKKWPEFFFSNSNLCLFVWLFIYLHIIIIIFKSNNRKTDKFSKTKEKNKTRGSSLVKCFFFFGWILNGCFPIIIIKSKNLSNFEEIDRGK